MDDIISSAKRVIPSQDFILKEAWDNMGFNKDFIKSNFSQALVSIDEKATEIFRAYEKKALLELAKRWLNNQKEDIKTKLKRIVSKKGWDAFIDEASQIFAEFGTLVQSLEKDLGNMRKARGGKAFEKSVVKLLDSIGISNAIPTGRESEILRRIDIVIPSVDIALKTPDRAIFLTCKRTLRERWKQEVPQARPNQRIYLLTIDEELSESKAREINDKGLIAFIRDELKSRENLKEMPWIRSLNDLPKELKGYASNFSI